MDHLVFRTIHRPVFQTIDYPGFRLFMETYLECDVPDELCRHLFLSFIKRPAPVIKTSRPLTPSIGKEHCIKNVAASASHTACAPVVHHHEPLSTSLLTFSDSETQPRAAAASSSAATAGSTASRDLESSGRMSHSLAEKLHGLSERIHQLGHFRHESGDVGKRSRAGESS